MQSPPNSSNSLQSHTEDIKSSLVFEFETIEQKLFVKAQSPKTLFSCTINPDPALAFELIKDLLIKRNFLVSNLNDDSLKLLLGGFYTLQFKSVQSLIFNQFKTQIQHLKLKINVQEINNAQLQQVIKIQETQITSLKTNFLAQIHSLTSNFTQLTERLSQLEQINRDSKERIKMMESITLFPNKIIKLPELHKHSEVVKTPEEAQTLQEFFGNKNIHFVQMLYRATEHQFSVHQFHGKCDGIPSTLTVCETEFGKKIGGYNPLVWSCSENNNYSSTSQSFIFSLTNKHKFEPNQAANSIRNYSPYGPCFGNGTNDLLINNNANTSNSNYSNINQQYMNKNYTKDDPVSWKKFNGNTGDKNQNQFKIKEWEVWRVVFEREENEKLAE